MKITNLKIGTRLGIGFAMLLTFTILVGILGLYQMAGVQQYLKSITEENNVEVALVTAMRATVFERATAVRNLVIMTSDKEMQLEAELIRREARKYAALEQQLARMFATIPTTTAEEIGLQASVAELAALAGPLTEKAVALGLTNKSEEAAALIRTE